MFRNKTHSTKVETKGATGETFNSNKVMDYRLIAEFDDLFIKRAFFNLSFPKRPPIFHQMISTIADELHDGLGVKKGILQGLKGVVRAEPPINVISLPRDETGIGNDFDDVRVGNPTIVPPEAAGWGVGTFHKIISMNAQEVKDAFSLNPWVMKEGKCVAIADLVNAASSQVVPSSQNSLPNS
ncbi:hypothetical protein HPP92_025321 [Vanilla planifolia]|uniref:Uncharacterized protein n=1 Tax=Vanilla planifolia TaxID=51239 RepID=A0A835PJC4_VANPL|nr:hypothetical protein HPP92_025321 [Vanilla planifolia]